MIHSLSHVFTVTELEYSKSVITFWKFLLLLLKHTLVHRFRIFQICEHILEKKFPTELDKQSVSI